MLDVLVVGGGITGLAAGFEAQKRGLNFAVLESGPTPGGVIGSVRRDGWTMELGAESMLASKPAARQLCQEMGIADQLIATNEEWRGTHIVVDGRVVDLPAGFRLMAPQNWRAFLTTPLLSWSCRWKMLRELWAQPLQAEQDISFADFVRQRFGQECLEKLAQPLGAGIFTASPEQLGLQAAFPQFYQLAKKGSVTRGLLRAAVRGRTAQALTQVGDKPSDQEDQGLWRAFFWSLLGRLRESEPVAFETMRHGMGSLVEQLAHRLGSDLQCLRPVQTIERLEDGTWSVTVNASANASAGNADQRLRAKKVILAVPAWMAARLLRSLEGQQQLTRELASIAYLSSATVNLHYRVGDITNPTKAYGMVIPHRENRQILACTYSHRKYPGRCPEGGVLLRAYLGGTYFPRVDLFSDNELADIAHQELASLLGIRQSPTGTLVGRYMDAMPVYGIGHRQRIARIQQAMAQLPGLVLAGNYLTAVGIPDCIESGRKAVSAQSD